jgi:hypothetical protein
MSNINLKEDQMSTKEQGFEPAAIDPGADRQLKAKHRALWASGDYPAVSAELIPTLGPELVRASGVRAGDRVLDVAAGSGNAAIAAAAAGAIVTASDLTPELFARSAHRRGTWGRGGMGGGRRGGVVVCGQRFRRRDVVRGSDVRAAPPGHRRRVTPSVPARGTIGMINWTPEGFIGKLFATMQPYAPPAPPGANPAPLWGDESHVRELLGERVTRLQMRREAVVMDRADPTEFGEYWKRNYGPTIAV